MKKAIQKEICLKRWYLLNKLYGDAKWLINSGKPLNQKHAIWKNNFDKFVIELSKQDKKLGLL
ncbi:MAG TPA: hypothetical protein VJH97_01860 [Candidatus Nanoarchaeia archaeon]|nr:hypothetical protein [Candidatus Nanoarchaeia archaeon]